MWRNEIKSIGIAAAQCGVVVAIGKKESISAFSFSDNVGRVLVKMEYQ